MAFAEPRRWYDANDRPDLEQHSNQRSGHHHQAGTASPHNQGQQNGERVSVRPVRQGLVPSQSNRLSEGVGHRAGHSSSVGHRRRIPSRDKGDLSECARWRIRLGILVFLFWLSGIAITRVAMVDVPVRVPMPHINISSR